jgi:hypothetical protein
MQLASKNKKNFLGLICLSFALSVFSQRELKEIQSSFNEYKNYNLSEKIFTHTDKDLYLAGEIMWFKLYVVNAEDNKPVDLSKLSYVEIINADQKPVLQTKVEVNKGTGNGSLYLPVSLNSGVYKLRAYTNWMKNFSAEYYFEKPITIVNTFKNLNIQPVQPRSFDLQFFPEGGNLVQNIQSRVAFKIVDQTGKGVNCNGFLVRNNSDTIAKFQPLKFGIGSFTFTPEEGSSYKAVIKLTDTTITKDLPKPLGDGYVLKVNDINESQLDLRISANIKSADFVYVFVHTRQQPDVTEKIFLKNGTGELRIEKNKLQEGISHITVFNNDMLPVCERLFFIQPKQKIIFHPTINGDQFASRKQVKLSVKSTDESDHLAPADLSVSVYRLDSFDSTQSCLIDNYFWLSSELKGRIESPGYYFSKRNAETDEAIDNLMLTHGWSRFTWQDVLQHTKPVRSFLPEYRGHIIYGKVTDKITRLPSPDVLAYLSVPGSRIQLYCSLSDSNGIVRFFTKDMYGPNELVLQIENTDNRHNLEITSSFSDKHSQKWLPLFGLPENMKNLLTDYNTAMQIQNNYSGSKLKRLFTPSVDSSAFFGGPDKIYKLDDYTRFSTMEEILREYVYEVLVRRQKENFRLIMADVNNKIFLDDPFTLFNGVPVFDPNKIMKYDPLKVREIDIVKSKYFFGPLTMNGIVNFITYEPDPSMLSELNAMILEYDGIQFQREFYSPVYENEEQISSHMPDFRNVLYWSPHIYTNAQGSTEISFFTSDMKGKYVVVLQGINADGRVGVKTVSFEVK